MKLPPHCELRPDSAALHADQLHVPHQMRKEPFFLDGTPESPQEHCHKSRGMLRSLQQRERAPCTPDQLEMRADSLASTQEEYQLSTSTSRGGFSQV